MFLLLKTSYKIEMKIKRKLTAGKIVALSLMASMVLICIGFSLFLLIVLGIPKTTRNITDFQGRDNLAQADGRDCFSYMLAFPENTENIQIQQFFSKT